MSGIHGLTLAVVIALAPGGAPPAADLARQETVERRHYEEAMEQALADVERQMREAEKRLHEMRADARTRFEHALRELRRRRRIVRHRLGKLRAHADAAWKELRSELDAALQALRKALRDTDRDPDVIET